MVHIDCSLILVLLTDILALLKIGDNSLLVAVGVRTRLDSLRHHPNHDGHHASRMADRHHRRTHFGKVQLKCNSAASEKTSATLAQTMRSRPQKQRGHDSLRQQPGTRAHGRVHADTSRIRRHDLPTLRLGPQTQHHRDERAWCNRPQLSRGSMRNPPKHGRTGVRDS